MYNKSINKSFQFAFHGLLHALKSQRNMRIHLYLAIGVILAGIILRLTNIELAILICVIGLVLTAEIINTALEYSLDFINGKKFHPTVKIIKDIFAGCVLLASINAVVIGSIIFLPHLFKL
ncbi:diacylglycerol kinase family protein [Candidatus Omnitrophota bacterium]